jgi:outer membrane beta-barrel protein
VRLPIAALLWAALIGVTALPRLARADEPEPPTPGSACVDDELKKELIGGRHYRGVQPRLFTKAFRHELSPLGGWAANDAIDSAPWYGGAYTFHFSEELALEASVGWSKARSRIAETLQQRSPTPIEIFRNDRTVRQYMGHLLWSIGYGKLRWMGGAINRFDFHIALGGGVTDDSESRGLTGSFGVGSKLYIASWFALRMDVRDQILSQKVLDERRIVNNILVLAGFSIFIPFSG